MQKLYRTLTYNSWVLMKQRCFNPNNPHFYRYGGRGIKVCARWRKSFENFLKDMGEAPKGFSIERIDNDWDYTPKNCCWIPVRQQARNRESNRYIEYKGKILGITEWSKRIGGSTNLVGYRLRQGWKIEEAITVPPLNNKSRIHYKKICQNQDPNKIE